MHLNGQSNLIEEEQISKSGSTIRSDLDRVVQEVLPLNIKIAIDRSPPKNNTRKKKSGEYEYKRASQNYLADKMKVSSRNKFPVNRQPSKTI